MQLVGSAGQHNGAQYLYDASVTIGASSTPTLVLPKAQQRSSLVLQNISAIDMYIEIGPARASCTISSGAVNAVSVTNAGFGYSLPPTVHFYGGAYINKNQISPTYTIAGLPEYAAPSRPAKAHCIMSGAAGAQTVSSIVIDDGGAGYAYPPFVYLRNNPNDPYGCAAPSATSGILLKGGSGSSWSNNGIVQNTDQVAVFCTSFNTILTCKFTAS